MRDAPENLGERVVATLRREHGDRWRALISTNGAAWLQIADEAPSPDADLYHGRLDEVRAPVLLIHGARDPRTEPGEIAAMTAALGGAVYAVRMLPEGEHSPQRTGDRRRSDGAGKGLSASAGNYHVMIALILGTYHDRSPRPTGCRIRP
jgi:hypothetical protein